MAKGKALAPRQVKAELSHAFHITAQRSVLCRTYVSPAGLSRREKVFDLFVSLSIISDAAGVCRFL